MYVIFFTAQDSAIKVTVSEGKFVNAKFYKAKVLRKINKYFRKRRIATGLANV
jgi:hypothetical protein